MNRVELLQGYLIGLERLTDSQLLDVLPKVVAFSAAALRGIIGDDRTVELLIDITLDDDIVVIDNHPQQH